MVRLCSSQIRGISSGFWVRSGAIALSVAAVLSNVPLGMASASPSPARPTGPFVNDHLHECLEPVPESASISGATDDGKVISLELLVLLDGITRQRGKHVMTTAAQSYEPLDIALKPTFRSVAFSNSGEYHEMEIAALDAVNGQRPRGFDLVYVMTSKDIHSQGDYNIAGFAFCIGGIRIPEMAFAVGEGTSPWEGQLNDPTFSVKIAAHEIGHLLGAHHHYGNCAEGNRSTDGGGEPSICTLMWPAYVAYAALNFGTLEATVVRGHAVDFASP